jgi:hypothetical protein
MSNVVIKDTTQKITDPSNDPTYKSALYSGQENWKKMESGFETEGQKKDYLRAVGKNKNNVVGYPPFFPPEKIRSCGVGRGRDLEVLPCGHKETRLKYDEKLEAKVVSCRYGHEYNVINNQFESVQ